MFKRYITLLPALGLLLLLTSARNIKKEDDQIEIKWYSIEEAMQLTKVNPKKIFIDVYTDWCGWCKVMDKNTFHNPKVAAYLKDNFYPVKFNAEQKEDLVYKGTTYKYVASGKNGYNEFAVALLNGKLSYPTTAFMDSEGQLITTVPGYWKAEDFYPILKFLGEDLYKKNMTFEDYKNKVYQSPF